MQFVDTLRNPTNKGLEQREAGNFPLQDDFKWPVVCGLEEFCIIQIYFAQKNYLKISGYCFMCEGRKMEEKQRKKGRPKSSSIYVRAEFELCKKECSRKQKSA